MGSGSEDNMCIVEFINMVYHIEERLPYLTLTSVLNKHNVVTQNIQTNPDAIGMLSLSLISVPPVLDSQPTSPSDLVELERLSTELGARLISFTLRQRAFKDYTNTGANTHLI